MLLQPRTEHAAAAAEQPQLVLASCKVERIEFWGAEIFKVVEVLEFNSDFRRGEEELKGLAGKLDAGCKGVVRKLLEKGQGGARLCVVKHKSGARRLRCNEGDGGAEGVASQVGNYSEPCKEGREGRIEACGVKLLRERLSFEIDRDVGEVFGCGKSARGEQIVLPLLRSGMIDLKDAKLRVRISVGKGVEACSEKNVLGHAFAGCAGEVVFRIAAAGDEKSAESRRKPSIGMGGGAAKFFGVGVAEDGNGDGVVEDEGRRIVELMRGTAQGYAKCSS